MAQASEPPAERAAAAVPPTVAIVGRPNVGKSTLFNRIVGSHRAIVDDTPGVTRDRLVAPAEWDGWRFAVVDTGGFETEGAAGLTAAVRAQSLRAVAEARVVVLVVDVRAGVAPADVELARAVARSAKPIVLAVNKVDAAGQEAAAYEFYRLGVGEPVPVSAEHARGLNDLLDRVVAAIGGARGGAESSAAALRLALLGRPNVGKSSLLNRLVGDQRALVHAEPGTTRDAVDTQIEVDGRLTVLVDTAGIRRRSRVDERLERASVAAALRAVGRADVALLVVDAVEGVTDQEARLARLVWERGRGLLLVFNKWDLLPPAARRPDAVLARAREQYRHLAPVPAVFVSALRGTHVEDVLPAARRVESAFRAKIATRTLNDVLGEATAALEPPLVKGRRARFYYAASVGSAPPVVVLFVNQPSRVTTAYLRYLENRIRAAIPLEGSPLRIVLRARPRGEGRPRRRRSE